MTFDSTAGKKKAAALNSARRNAAASQGWLAAGVAAVAIGIGLMARAAKSKQVEPCA